MGLPVSAGSSPGPYPDGGYRMQLAEVEVLGPQG
jgi:hypothetical protein